jgi:hypothetical protein
MYMHMSKRKGEIVTTLAVQQAQAIDSPHVNKKRRGGKAKKQETRNKKHFCFLPRNQIKKGNVVRGLIPEAVRTVDFGNVRCQQQSRLPGGYPMGNSAKRGSEETKRL